jgi:hypothetical protein
MATGARLVKSISNMPMEWIRDFSPTKPRTVIFASGDDAEAKQSVIELINSTGLVAIDQAHSKPPRAPWEIEAWSAFMEKRAPDSDAETLAFFAENLGKISKTREDVKTWFEFGELDDYVSFGGKA